MTPPRSLPLVVSEGGVCAEYRIWPGRAASLTGFQAVTPSPTSAPAGWTLGLDTSGTGLSSQIYQRVATGADVNQSYTWTITGDVGLGTMVAVRGAAGLVPAGKMAGSYYGSDTSITAPSVTSTAANSLLLNFTTTMAGSTPAGARG